MAPAITALYCHIPFCHTICPFCAFAVHGNRPALHGGYLAALRREIQLGAALHGGGRPAGEPHPGETPPVAALYIGGGTPSTLSLRQVGALLGWLGEGFPFAPDIEIAFEVNPEDARPEYLAGLKAVGVNRLSLGLQSLHGPTLAALGRNNTPEQGLAAAEAVARHGPPNHNFDLMCGAPAIAGQVFRDDLARVAELRPPHLSLYGLDLEPGTLFARSGAVRAWNASHGEAQASQLLWAAEFLAALGYRHYEVSNFCLPGREGRQNLAVWAGENYLGFGVGAHSHLNGERWHNQRHLRAYQRELAAGVLPVAFRERLTLPQRANEGLMLALRQGSGLAVAHWEQTFGIPWGARRQAVAQRLTQQGQARWEGGQLTLTARGMLVADAITAELMVD